MLRIKPKDFERTVNAYTTVPSLQPSSKHLFALSHHAAQIFYFFNFIVCFETGSYCAALGGLELCIDHAGLKLTHLPASTLLFFFWFFEAGFSV